jgi:hypothetical protein
MNASFPYVLPSVQLPTEPPMVVTDAGVADNFGTTLSVRFLHCFRHWITAHTRGVIVIQVRDSEHAQEVKTDITPSLLGRLTGQGGALYQAISNARDYQKDELYRLLQPSLQVPLQVFELQYLPQQRYQRASLNFHLTEREKADIRAALARPENQAVFGQLRGLFAPR